MKRLELVFNIVSIFMDASMLVLAGSAAYYLRFRSEELFPQYPILFEMSYSEFLRNILLALPVVLVILALYGLYNLSSTKRFWAIALRVSAGVSTGLMLFVAMYFFDQQIFPSRLIVLMTWVFAMVAVGMGRFVLQLTERAFLKKGIGLHKTVIISDGGKDYGLSREFSEHPELGYQLVARITNGGNVLEDIKKLQSQYRLDEIFYTRLNSSEREYLQLVDFAHDHSISFNYVPDIVEAQQTNINVSTVGGIPILELKNTPLAGWGRVVKRLLDLVLSGVGLTLFAPIFFFIALMIRLDSKGKIFFVQERYGQGRPFMFYKFRTMYQHMSVGDEYGGEQAEKMRTELWKANARGTGPFLKIKNDPRVTKVGKLLRSTKLDELPQLINVFKGDMSLVGPRAHVLEEVDKYREQYRRQFTIKPGITGMAQLSQLYVPDLAFEEEIRLNTFYIENWSLRMDIHLIMKTVWLLMFRPKKEQDYY